MSKRIPVTIDRAWRVGADGVAYPPQPWFLGGSIVMTAFAVPRAELPADTLKVIPPSARLLTARGMAVVVAAFLSYGEGGVLQYEELLTAYPVVSGRHGPRVSIPQIWVTSANSRIGGRELWGIPKQMGAATREVSDRVVRTSMAADGAPIAALDARLGRALLPGRRQIPLPTAQILEGRRSWSTNRLVARTRSARTRWNFDPDGPLGHLAGRRTLFSCAADDAVIIFGTEVSHD